MIVPILLPLALHRDLSHAQEIGAVRAFVNVARTGLNPNEVLPPYPVEREEPRLDKVFSDYPRNLNLGIRSYDFARATVYIDTLRGRISGFYDSAAPGSGGRRTNGTLVDRKVTNAQAITLARRFYAASGWPGELAVIPNHGDHGEVRDVVDGAGNNGSGLEIHYVPEVGGVLYDEGAWQAILYINRQTGQLEDFGTPNPNLPPPPPILTPRGSAADAQAVALRFGTELRGEALAMLPADSLRLRVWYPETKENNSFYPEFDYSPQARMAVAAHRGVLAYVGELVGGSWQAGVHVAVDALTGEIIGARGFSPPGSSGGVGGEGAVVPTGLLDVPASERTWRVATGGKGWNGWTPPAKAVLSPVSDPVVAGTKLTLTDGKAAKGWNAWSSIATANLALVNDAAPTGAKLTLTDGKAAFPATYDPTTGLLGISGKAYRPGPALAELLKRRAK